MEEYRNYYLRCRAADWFYDYSDDHRVWEKGQKEIYGLMREAYDDNVKQRIYDEFRKYVRGERERPTSEEFGYEV